MSGIGPHTWKSDCHFQLGYVVQQHDIVCMFHNNFDFHRHDIVESSVQPRTRVMQVRYNLCAVQLAVLHFATCQKSPFHGMNVIHTAKVLGQIIQPRHLAFYPVQHVLPFERYNVIGQCEASYSGWNRNLYEHVVTEE